MSKIWLSLYSVAEPTQCEISRVGPTRAPDLQSLVIVSRVEYPVVVPPVFVNYISTKYCDVFSRCSRHRLMLEADGNGSCS